MTLDEAIKVKENYKDSYASLQCPEEKEADRLSIEALKREVRRRKVPYYGGYALLPGETE